MSYILDALKKSEQERQRGEIPDLLSVQDDMTKRPEKRLLWPYVLVAVLLLNAVILGWWLIPLQHKKQPIVAAPNNTRIGESKISVPPVPRQTEVVSPETKTAESKPTLKSEPLVQQHYQRAKVKNALTGTTTTDVTPKVDVGMQRKGSQSLAEQSQMDTHRTAAMETGSESAPPPENKVYQLGDLPPSIREKLPAFTISTSLYSEDPSARLVKINGTTLREGNFLSAGLKLEEITPDGVIFNFQNYHFRVGLK
ncbi:MAG: general secretion pathway protein GspB [Dissulfurispiraceae bacterium]